MFLLFSKWCSALYHLLPAIILAFMSTFKKFLLFQFLLVHYHISFIMYSALDAFMFRPICDASFVLSFTVFVMCFSARHKNYHIIRVHEALSCSSEYCS